MLVCCLFLALVFLLIIGTAKDYEAFSVCGDSFGDDGVGGWISSIETDYVDGRPDGADW